MQDLIIKLTPAALEWLRKKAAQMGYGEDISETAGVLLEMMQGRDSKKEDTRW